MFRQVEVVRWVGFVVVALGLAGGLLPGCGDDEFVLQDVVRPSRVMDLTARQISSTSAVLRWTAPGDDGAEGTATAYDIRMARQTITLGNWATLDRVPGTPEPRAAGAAESVRVEGLRDSVTYYFALIAEDEAANQSLMSNEAQFRIDTAPPGRIDDLAADSASMTIVYLSWTAVGDDGEIGTAVANDLRYHTVELTEANWDAATPVVGLAPPYPAGALQRRAVTGLNPGTDYWFGLKVSDDAGLESPLSNVVTARTD